MADEKRFSYRKNRKMIILIAILFLVCILYFFFKTHITVIEPNKTDEVLVNPMTGFVPRADYYDAVIDSGATLVYLDVTWRQLEPQQGVYDFEGIEEDNHLDEWRDQGKRVVFRFLCDVPEDDSHMDIPDWLYEETGGDGDWYNTSYGKGYSPNYNNEFFIERHRKAIKALGEYYGGDDFFCYIELGSLGHWGEWHVKYSDGITRLPMEDVREQYITPYVEYFPNAMIMMRRPFNPVAEYNFGLYNDMTGAEEDTKDWLDWINLGGDYNQTGEENALTAMPDAWKTAPIGGEFTSSLTMEQLLQDNIDKTAELIAESHMTFIGPKIPVGNELINEGGIDTVLSLLGYRLRIERAVITQYPPFINKIKIKLAWVNDGCAPIYKDWPVYLYILNAEGDVIQKVQVDIDLRTVVDDTLVVSAAEIPGNDLPEGVYDIGIAVFDPSTGEPEVELAMENSRSDKIYRLGQWEKK